VGLEYARAGALVEICCTCVGEAILRRRNARYELDERRRWAGQPGVNGDLVAGQIGTGTNKRLMSPLPIPLRYDH
jgi:hypothetical protein